MRVLRSKKTLFFACLGIVALVMIFFRLTSPIPQAVSYTRPDLETINGQPLTLVTRDFSEDGLYWMDFTLAGQWLSLDHLILRTRGCLTNLSINNQPIALQERNWSFLCDNTQGIRLKNMSGVLSQKSQWALDGTTPSSSFGISIEKDWTEPILIFALGLLILSLVSLLYLSLPVPHGDLRLFIAALLGLGFFIRFWGVFISRPPELAIWSDMAGYVTRALEIGRGEYNHHQLFQPVGFTLWGKWLRDWGGWELFNWGQVFLSWGTSVLTVLISLRFFSRAVTLLVLLVSVFHLLWIGSAQFYLSENLYGFLITLSFYLGLKLLKTQKWADFFVLGVLTMLSFYVKGTHSFFVPLFSVWWLYKNRQQFAKAFLQLSVMAVGCLLVAGPHLIWTAKNYGKPYFGPTAGALNFIEGKCPSKNNADSEGASWMSPLFSVTGENLFKKWDRPFSDQAYFYKEGLKCIMADPWVLVSSVRFVYYLFYDNMMWPLGTLPNAHAIDVWSKLFSYLFIPMSLLGFLVLRRSQSAVAKVGGLYVLSLCLTVYIYKSELRFRVPFDGIFILWGSYGVIWLYEKLRQESKSLVFHNLPSHVGQGAAKFHSVQARVDEDLDL